IDHAAAGQPRVASLYDQLFRKRATVDPPDPVFTEDARALNGAITAHALAITESAPLAKIGELSGSSFLEIKDSINALQRKNLDVSHERIAVLSDGSSNVVVFSAAPYALSQPHLAVRRYLRLEPGEFDALAKPGKFKVVDESTAARFLQFRSQYL